jgi:hypothetical protein
VIYYLWHQSRKKWIWLVLLFFSTTIFASTNYPYLGATLGTSIAEVGNKHPHIIYYNGDLNDAYPSRGNHVSTAIMSINGGYEFGGVGWIPSIAFGLGIYNTLGNYGYKGQLIETAMGDPSSTLYDYKYQVNNTSLMLEAQFIWIVRKFAPFINIGAGSAWNRMSGYKENPVNDTGYVPVPPFQSHTNTNFAYQAGFGVGYAFDFANGMSGYQHERISLGYRYANLGDASFGTRGAVYPYSLDTGRLTTHELYLAYTHLF